MMFLTTTWFGCFLFDEGQVVDQRLFPADPREIADRYERIRAGEVLEEERELAVLATDLMVEDRRLLALGNAALRDSTDGIDETDEAHGIDETDEAQGIDETDEAHGIDEMDERDGDHDRMVGARPDPAVYSMSADLLREALILVASRKLERAFAVREIIELIATLDDLNRSINLLHERESEWKKVYGDRESPSVLGSFRERIRDLEEHREELKQSIESFMRQENPTLSHLVGELLGARIIALARGRDRLARLPAGTIQILGAENAFFRFRKTGKGMPKHGIIFQHPWIKNAGKDQRGKIARTLAGKIALAARIDHYSGRNDGEVLRSAVEKRIRDMHGRGKVPAVARSEEGPESVRGRKGPED